MDPEGWKIGDWSLMTPKLMRDYSEEFLNYVSEHNRGGVHDIWAMAELARRQSQKLGELIVSLEAATTTVHKEVVTLGVISQDSAVEVKRPLKSSLKIESLTKWLVGLTVILAVLTFVLCFDEGMKLKKEYFSEHPPPTAPQSPYLPDY